MTLSRRSCLSWLSGALAGPLSPALHAQTDFSAYTDAQKEKFLLTAGIVSVEDIGHGVTKPVRAIMELGGVRHDANIQVVNKELPYFFPPEGKPIPMIDSWRFNVAAYKVDRLLGLGMVAVAVRRLYQGKPAAISWWVDDVQFEEVDRVRKGLQSPNPEDFEQQRAVSRVFDELVLNIDRNLSNMLITRSWRIALIDHSRCFTAYPGIRNQANLTRCSRPLLAAMKALSSAGITKAAAKLLTPAETNALLTRRDRIIAFFEKEAREKGESSVLFG